VTHISAVERSVEAGDLRKEDVVPDGTKAQVAAAGLTKRFGPVVAVDEVSLAVAPGEFLVLLGPSGSGKSTLLRMIAGIDRPSAGTIHLGGALVDGPGVHTPPERRELAMVFQDYALWPHMTAAQNVQFALRRRRMERRERERAARDALERVGLSSKESRYPGELSGGEQQRVALARALVAQPGLLLFDEPLSNLDADRREQLRVDIAALVREQGTTAIYITHDQFEAFALADKIGVLDRGRLVQLATPEEIFRAPATPFVARFTGLAGEIPGVVEEVTKDRVTVSTPAGLLAGTPFPGSELRRGANAQLLIRPSAGRFGDEEQVAHARVAPFAGSVAAGETVIQGEVIDAAFRGWGYEHVVSVPGGRLHGVPAARRIAPGARARLVLVSSGSLVAPAGSGEASA